SSQVGMSEQKRQQQSAESDEACPQCGHQLNADSSVIVPIVYGRPSSELMASAEAGRVKLGGCCISPDSPTLHCKKCDVSFKPMSM
ncbi:hypothetical protein BOX15_Mlig009883g3, partial [Macrostomum lignano]